jgi:hypothetical protein
MPLTFEDIDRVCSHGERFRLVYNFENDDDSPAVHDPIPIRGVAAWSPVFPVWDSQPFEGTFPPAAPRAAANALEVYTAPVAPLQLGNMPATGHQTYAGITVGGWVGATQSGAWSGVSSYSMGGVGQFVAGADALGTLIEMPAGVCVFQYVGRTWPFIGTTALETQRLHWLKTKGIVQVLVDATAQAPVAAGNWLQMVTASWNLGLAASWNTQIGNFWALEAVVAAATPIYTWPVGVDY